MSRAQRSAGRFVAALGVAVVGLAACGTSAPRTASPPAGLAGSAGAAGPAGSGVFCGRAQQLASAIQSGGTPTDLKSVQAAIARERDVASGLVAAAPSAYKADVAALRDALAQSAQALTQPPPANDPQAALSLYQTVAGYFQKVEPNLTHLGAYLKDTCHLNINLGLTGAGGAGGGPAGG